MDHGRDAHRRRHGNVLHRRRQARGHGRRTDRQDTGEVSFPWYSKFTIPAGTYDGQAEPVQTTAVKMLLLTDASMPDDVVYDLAKTFWENLDSLGKAHAVIKTVTKEMAVSDLSGIPLHPGAEKYYREIGLLK